MACDAQLHLDPLPAAVATGRAPRRGQGRRLGVRGGRGRRQLLQVDVKTYIDRAIIRQQLTDSADTQRVQVRIAEWPIACILTKDSSACARFSEVGENSSKLNLNKCGIICQMPELNRHLSEAKTLHNCPAHNVICGTISVSIILARIPNLIYTQ